MTQTDQSTQSDEPVEEPEGLPALVTTDFDPFTFMSLYRGLKNKPTARLGIVGVVVVGLLLFANLVDGTMGTFHDFHLWSDIQRPFGAANLPRSDPSFPLMRDVTTWFLALTTISGAILLHRQWDLMSTCISKLKESGAITNLEKARSNSVSRILGIDKLVRGAPSGQALNIAVSKIVNRIAKHSRVWFVLLLTTSIVLAVLLQSGQKSDLFATFAPPRDTPEQRQEWLALAYRNWWASDHHTLAYIVYLILAIFAILIILHFEVVGIIALYITIVVYFTVDLRANWMNTDGRHGWSPIARTYRTVLWANALLGGTLAVVLMALGFSNYRWVSVLVVLYAIFMPMFTLVPWLVFRRVESNARSTRVKQIQDIIVERGLDIDKNIVEIAPFIAEIERCQATRIRPLRMGTASFSTYVVVVVLPIVLAAAQIWLPLKYAAK